MSAREAARRKARGDHERLHAGLVALASAMKGHRNYRAWYTAQHPEDNPESTLPPTDDE